MNSGISGRKFTAIYTKNVYIFSLQFEEK